MSNCTHTETVDGEWVESFIDHDGKQHYRWKPEWEKPTTAGIDLHHYICTQCGKIFSY